MKTWLQPANFRPQDLFPPRRLYLWEKSRYVIHLLTLAAAKLVETDERGFRRLCAGTLKSVIGDSYRQILDILIENGLIDCDPCFSQVKHVCRGYKLGERLLCSRLIKWHPCDPDLVAKLNAREEEKILEQRSLRLHIHDALHLIQLRDLSIDELQAESIVNRLPANCHLCCHVAIDSFKNGTLPNTVGPVGRRWFNGLSSLPKQLRNAVRIGGEPLASLDLKASQPTLLANLIASQYPALRGGSHVEYWVDADRRDPCLENAVCRDAIGLVANDSYPGFRLRNGPSDGLSLIVSDLDDNLAWLASPAKTSPPVDLARFVDLCCSGTDPAGSGLDLYELLADRCGFDPRCPSCRSELKKLCLQDVIAWRGDYWSAVRKAFKSLFPSVLARIGRVNYPRPGESDPHAILIRLLQRLESHLVLETVCPLLVDICPVVPLHDAIFCRPSDLPVVSKAFRTAFRKLGLRMRLSEERYPKEFSQVETCTHFENKPKKRKKRRVLAKAA